MYQDSVFPLPRTGGNENTAVLKALAILFMVTDHVGAALLKQYSELRIIGRIAFPLFVWCLVVGTEYTRNIWKYALRILLVGIVSQPCFMLALNHKWNQLNVFATLLIGLLGLAAIRVNKFGSRYWGPVVAILIACGIEMDYGWQGVLFVFLLYGCRKQRSAIASVMIAYCLYMGYGTYTITKAFGIQAISSIPFLAYSGRLMADIARIEFWAILALPLILWPMKTRTKMPKMIGYAAYPVHLLIIGLIRNWDHLAETIKGWF